MFWLDDALSSNIYIDGIITVLDSKNIIKNHQKFEIRRCQKTQKIEKYNFQTTKLQSRHFPQLNSRMFWDANYAKNPMETPLIYFQLRNLRTMNPKRPFS